MTLAERSNAMRNREWGGELYIRALRSGCSARVSRKHVRLSSLCWLRKIRGKFGVALDPHHYGAKGIGVMRYRLLVEHIPFRNVPIDGQFRVAVEANTSLLRRRSAISGQSYQVRRVGRVRDQFSDKIVRLPATFWPVGVRFIRLFVLGFCH